MKKEIRKLFNLHREAILTHSELENAVLKIIEKKPIDNVTIDILDVALRTTGIFIAEEQIDHLIDLVELIEDKGEKASLKDIAKLKVEWEK